MKRYGIVTDRMHMVKTKDDKVFRFAKVIFLKDKIFSRELIPMDEDTGRQITELRLFKEETQTFHPVDIKSFRMEGLRSYSFRWAKERET